MEYDEHEEQEEEEEMGLPVTLVAGYDSLGNSAVRSKIDGGSDGGIATTTTSGGRKGGIGTIRYKECQKNHAVSIGGYAVDGCCEFLAAGEEGTLEAVICAACNCHRNFHLKEIDGEFTSHNQQQQRYHHHHHHQLSPYYHRAAPPLPPPGFHHHHLLTPPVSQHRPLALPPVRGFSREDDDVSNPSSSGGGGGGGSGGGSGTKKRFRTKFTQEQKDKMLEFAEKIGWRIQKEDEGAIERFCAENFIKRKVLKVWMHNNKHTLGKKP